jgi:phytoene/squalene synthetase
MEPGAPPPSSSQIREQPPADGSWRADALARSRHSRLDQEIRAPQEDLDEERSRELCAEICRGLLGDFTPALLLLSPAERCRAQAFLAYVFTLFDFARQRGVEGERLAQINRWEFTLEAALAGQPVGQPVFLGMAREQKRRPWPVEALDGVAACARRRATRPRPATPGEADADAERLARAVSYGLTGAAPPGEVSAFVAALVRLRTLQSLGAEMNGRRCPLPLSELPDDEIDEVQGAAPDPGRLFDLVQRECRRLRPRLLRAPRGLMELPPGYRRAAIFCLLAGLRLLTQIEDGDAGLLDTPPQLGVLSRLGFLARARWFPV